MEDLLKALSSPCPPELIADFGQPQSEDTIEEQVQELLLYELGFLVCMAIGLLFIILVPLVGCCFCCCRCCGNCGGRLYQKQGRPKGGIRWDALEAGALQPGVGAGEFGGSWAGDVCAFVSNTRFSQAVVGTFPIPGVERQLKALRDVSGSNIAASLEEVNSTLDTIPAKVQEQSQDVVTKAQDQLGFIRQEIRSLQEQVPLLGVEENVGAFVGNATSMLEEYREPVITVDGLRWGVCVLLCCMVLLVVLCNSLWLLLGPLGLKESMLPTQRSSLSNAGGNSLSSLGVGFGFIFSWLLMLLVLIPFVLGGNIYMLVCESWRNQQLFELLDTPGLIPGFNLSELLGQEGGTANFSEIYRQCQRDTALWQTLHLDQSVSLDELLNISQYTGEISTAFEKLTITLSPISLLNQSQRDLLLNASRDGQPPDFTSTLEQLEQSVTQGSLLDLAAELEQLADKAEGNVTDDLKADASKLRELDGEMQTSFSGPLQSLKDNIHLVQSGAAQLEAQTKAALDKASETQEFLEREMANIIKNESWAFLEELLDFFETYISWAKSSLTGDVARCKPIAQSLDNVEAIACDYILDSLNAFWFSLGWCTFFLLPSIILSVRLAKFYRRMDIADVYSRRLSWLQTRAQLLGKLGGTEIVARGAVCHHVGERGE
nr:PREDICTED: prominin-1-A-like [Opisthocomus hoazin]